MSVLQTSIGLRLNWEFYGPTNLPFWEFSALESFLHSYDMRALWPWNCLKISENNNNNFFLNNIFHLLKLILFSFNNSYISRNVFTHTKYIQLVQSIFQANISRVKKRKCLNLTYYSLIHIRFQIVILQPFNHLLATGTQFFVWKKIIYFKS